MKAMEAILTALSIVWLFLAARAINISNTPLDHAKMSDYEKEQ